MPPSGLWLKWVALRPCTVRSRFNSSLSNKGCCCWLDHHSGPWNYWGGTAFALSSGNAWLASICKRTTHNITDLWQWSPPHPTPPPPHSSVCLKAYSQTMLQAVKKLLHPVWYITLRSPFVFCIYVCCCLTIVKFFAIQSTFFKMDTFGAHSKWLSKSGVCLMES